MEQGSILANEFITQKHIPLRSPNFGGLWEADIQSFKHYQHWTSGRNKVTLEVFKTLKIQIEGIVNLKLLLRLLENANELEILTPRHLFIGYAICAILELNIIDISDNRLSHCANASLNMYNVLGNFGQLLQQYSKWQFKK